MSTDHREALIQFRSVSHRFHDGKLGLDTVCLDIYPNDFLVLAGRNGSGKTLLVRHLITLVLPGSGEILFRGSPIGRKNTTARSSIGLVFQDTESQLIGQTVLEDVEFGPASQRLPAEEVRLRALKALTLVRLSDKAQRRPDSLSGGERRLLSIAGILAMGPECLVFDEPFANLDYPAIRQVLSIITQLHAEGKTIILLTHELEKVLAHATRLAIMEEGRMVFQGSPESFDAQQFESYGLMNPFRYTQSREKLTWLK